jgi:hypothetical protein
MAMALGIGAAFPQKRLEGWSLVVESRIHNCIKRIYTGMPLPNAIDRSIRIMEVDLVVL